MPVEGAVAETKVETVQISGQVSPLLGFILVGVAVLYLIVLIYQVVKSRNNAQYEYTNSSDYSDLSISDSEGGRRRRRRDSYDSVPNTCSYMESQLYTPNESLLSVDQGATGSQVIVNHNNLPQFGEQGTPKIEFIDDIVNNEALSSANDLNVHYINRDLEKRRSI